MLDSQEIQTVASIIRSLLKEHNMLYKVMPFDDELYQECIDEARRRGYPIDGDESLGRYLPDGIRYATIASGCHATRPARKWIAFYTAATFFADDIPCRFPSDIPDLYLFNNRFIKNQKQGNAALDALADIIRWAPDFFQPIFSNLITTSCLDMVTSTLVEHETTSMKVSRAAEHYPAYQRYVSGLPEAYTFILFPREMPFTEYIQALPEIMKFITEANDVLSFYKEELEGEKTNQISIIAARNNETKLEALGRMTGSITELYKTIVKILGESSEACNAFRHFFFGYFDFHFTVKRYRLADLEL